MSPLWDNGTIPLKVVINMSQNPDLKAARKALDEWIQEIESRHKTGDPDFAATFAKVSSKATMIALNAAFKAQDGSQN